MVELISIEARNLITQGILLTRHLCLRGNWDGPHGQDHWARVACMAEVLRLNTEATEYVVSMEDVVVPAILHDLGRIGDTPDHEHGVRGARPAAKGLMLMEETGLCHLGRGSWGRAIDTVIHHCEKGSSLWSQGIFVRDADILDIYRDGKNRVNTDRLSTMASVSFAEQAKAFSRTEWDFSWTL